MGKKRLQNYKYVISVTQLCQVIIVINLLYFSNRLKWDYYFSLIVILKKKKHCGKILKQKPPSKVAFHLSNKRRWRRQCARFTEADQSPTKGNMLESPQIHCPSIPNSSPKVSLHTTPFSTTKLLFFSRVGLASPCQCSMTDYCFPHLHMLFFFFFFKTK